MESISVNEESHQWPQILAVSASLVLAVSSGIQFAWPSCATPRLLRGDLQFNVTEEQVSYIMLIHPLSYILSGPISAFLQDKIGRKYSLLTLVVPQITGWFLIALSSNINTIYLSRLVSGTSEGCVFAILPVYICEISQPRVRGMLGVSFSIAVVLGFLLITLYGSFMPLRMSAYVSICFPILFFITFVWMPESPYYLVLKGHIDSARLSLQRLRKMENVEDELVKLHEDIQREVSECSSLKEVFTTRNNRKALLISMGLRTLQQFSGGAAIYYYNQVIFQYIGGSLYLVASISFYATLVLVCSFSLTVIDRYGRRPLLLISTSCTAVLLLVEAIYFTFQYHGFNVSKVRWLPVTALILYTIVRGIGLFSIPNLLIGELFSASIKAKAIGILNVYLALLISGVTKLFHYLKSAYGMYAPFYVFVCATIVGVVFIYYFVPETKRKTLQEIQEQLRGSI